MAIAILIDLSPGSQLMQTNGIQNLKGNISSDKVLKVFNFVLYF